jgi:ABC-type lipoprotein release transport system permease subunit
MLAPMGKPSFVARIVLVVGALSGVLAAVLYALIPTQSFGWFDYEPLDSTVVLPPLVTPQGVLAVVAAVSCLVLVSGWIGWRLGRRSRTE